MVWYCGRYKLGVSSYFEAAFFFRGKLFQMDFFFFYIRSSSIRSPRRTGNCPKTEKRGKIAKT